MTDKSLINPDLIPAPEDEDADTLGYYRRMQDAVEVLLILKGIMTPEDLAREMKAVSGRTFANGGKVVARAWTDPAYRERLLKDPAKACAELGFDLGAMQLVVHENTPKVHNVIVCTLCSCYPRMLLGMPPDWYKSMTYRSRVVREPRAVLKEFGTAVPDEVEIRVHDSTADLRYMVLPMRPAGTEGLDEDTLAALVTRDCLLGVTQPLLKPTPAAQ